MRIPIVLTAIALDQATKAAVSRWMNPGESLRVAGDVVRLTYIHNPGAVFGLTFGGRPLHLALSLAALVLVAAVLRKTPATEVWSQAALSMVLGGAVGNLIDRFRLGEVIDFLDVGVGSLRWYVFNVADAFVTVGVLLLMVSIAFPRSREGRQGPGTAPESHAAEPGPGS